MKKILTAVIFSLALATSPVLAHHPAADMVDEEIYAVIDELVSDTPHATLVFDEEMGTTEITTESVSDAEDIIDDYLLADLSLLEEEVSITITFEDTLVTTFDDEVELAESGRQKNAGNTNEWLEGQEWGRRVIITVNTLLCNPDYVEGEDPLGSDCEPILPDEQ